MFEIKNLEVGIESKKIIKDLNLKLEKGKIYALMGPNGCGKSTLAQTIAGSPNYNLTSGEIIFKDEIINELKPDKRAKKGIFLSFQYPQEVSGVTIYSFLRHALKSSGKKIGVLEFGKIIKEKARELGIKEDFLERYLNEGFSGGEKKRSEILQMLVLNPELVILDETDSGLDIDSIKVVAEGIKKFAKENKTILIITHYKRILEYVKPDKVFVMAGGKIVGEGKREIIDKLEKDGYKGFLKN